MGKILLINVILGLLAPVQSWTKEKCEDVFVYKQLVVAAAVLEDGPTPEEQANGKNLAVQILQSLADPKVRPTNYKDWQTRLNDSHQKLNEEVQKSSSILDSKVSALTASEAGADENLIEALHTARTKITNIQARIDGAAKKDNSWAAKLKDKIAGAVRGTVNNIIDEVQSTRDYVTKVIDTGYKGAEKNKEQIEIFQDGNIQRAAMVENLRSYVAQRTVTIEEIERELSAKTKSTSQRYVPEIEYTLVRLRRQRDDAIEVMSVLNAIIATNNETIEVKNEAVDESERRMKMIALTLPAIMESVIGQLDTSRLQQHTEATLALQNAFLKTATRQVNSNRIAQKAASERGLTPPATLKELVEALQLASDERKASTKRLLQQSRAQESEKQRLLAITMAVRENSERGSSAVSFAHIEEN